MIGVGMAALKSAMEFEEALWRVRAVMDLSENQTTDLASKAIAEYVKSDLYRSPASYINRVELAWSRGDITDIDKLLEPVKRRKEGKL